MSNPTIMIETEHGSMTAELYPEVAPETTANFIKLAQSGFYDGLIFHRVIPGFMIQGGDPDGDGTGGPGWTISGEFSDNGFVNDISHERGVISMARTNDPDSAGSQFFIVTADAPHLNGHYAAFGKLTDGFDALDAIEASPTDRNDRPETEQRMLKLIVNNK